MNVHIVTCDNGRIHSVHTTSVGADLELDRAKSAGEIWGTGIEQHEVCGAVSDAADRALLVQTAAALLASSCGTATTPEQAVAEAAALIAAATAHLAAK